MGEGEMARRQKYIFAKKYRAGRIRKIILIILIIIAAVLAALLLISKKNLFGPSLDLKADLTAEAGTELHASDFIDKVNGGTLKEDPLIDTSTPGTKDVAVTIVSDSGGEESDAAFQVDVVDTTPPVIELTADQVNVILYTEIDWAKFASVTDNSSTEPEMTASGLDTSAAGQYQVTFSASDASGNSAEKNLTVNVIDPDATEGDITFVTGTGFTGTRIDGVTTIDGIIIANKSFSLPEDYGSGDLEDVTYEAYYEMDAAAAAEGYSLWISSGYRSYWLQYRLYTSYGATDGFEAADRYSSRPGYSDHQTGYTIDLNSVDDSFGESEAGQWVNAHCAEYGFVIRYPEGKEDKTGYIYESWHLRYVGTELAQKLYNGGDWISLEEYFGISSRYSPSAPTFQE